MARPPIVISNGGMASALTEGLEPNAENKGKNLSREDIILDNVIKMNSPGAGNNELGPPVAKTLSGSNKLNEPRIYWRFEDENEYQPTKPGSKAEELGLEAQ